MNARSYSRAPALLLIGLAVDCGLGVAQLATPVATAPALEWLERSRPLAQISLESAGGEFNTTSMLGHWQLLALGFTHCPDLCPTTLSQLSALREALAGNRVRILFVSVDRARDSPQQLAAYVAFFGADFIGLTGANAQLHRLADSLGMAFRLEGTPQQPEISHSPTIALIGPDGVADTGCNPTRD